MTLQYQSGLLITGTNADRTGTTWTNLAAGWKFFETDTLILYYWTGSVWSRFKDSSLPSQGKFGAWCGGSPTATNGGIWSAAAAAIAVGTGTVIGIQRDATGLSFRWTTAATINSLTGMRMVNTYCERSFNPVLEMQVAVQQTTLERIFLGWRASVSAPASAADPLAGGIGGIMFGVDTGVDNNWHIYQNDSSGGSDSTTIANVAALDTSAHKFALRAVEASSKFQYAYNFSSIENATWVDINTTIPIASLGLAPYWYIENLEAAAKTFQMYYAQTLQDK